MYSILSLKSHCRNISQLVFYVSINVPYFVDRKICGNMEIFEKMKTRSLAIGRRLAEADLALWPNRVAI